MDAIGLTIKKLREKEKLSLRELAERSGIVYSQLSRYENGKTAPSINSIEAICEALNISSSEFLIIAKHELFTDPKGRMAFDALAPLFQQIADVLADLSLVDSSAFTVSEDQEATVYDEHAEKVRYVENYN